MTIPHFLFLMLINVLWGFNFIAAYYAVSEFPPIFMTAIRFLLLLLFVLPFVRVPSGRMKALLLVAVVMGFHFAFSNAAIWLAGGVGPVAIVLLTNIPIATLLAIAFLGERIGLVRIVGIVVAFMGVVVLAWDRSATTNISAILVAMGAATSYATGAILMRRLKGVHPFTVQCWVAIVGIPLLLALTVVLEEGQVSSFHAASWLGWSGILYGTLMASIVGHAGMNWLLQRYEVVTIAPFTVLTQVFAVIFGVLMLSEPLGFQIILGGLLTMAGVTIITMRMRQKYMESHEGEGNAL